MPDLYLWVFPRASANGLHPKGPTVNVQRIRTDTGSHIEPPLDQDWPDLQKLEWHAAVCEHDTGVRVRVHLVSTGYSIQVGNSSASGRGFYDAWTYINGVFAGAEAVKGLA